jgi:type I restriction enzyme, S subunit
MTADKSSPFVPRLRFPEFIDHGPWDARPLDDLCDRRTETVGDSKLTPVSISAGKGFVPQTEKFGRDISGSQYSKYIWLRRGDFAYNRGNSKRFPQGCVYQLTEFDEAAASNAFYCFRLHDHLESAFVRGFFENNGHGRQLSRHITSGARSNGLLNIHADTFFGITVPMPRGTAEQQKIANCLGSLDDLIAAEGRKLKALRQHKQGLMQVIFPQPGESVPLLRFPAFKNAPKWEARELGPMTSKIGSGVTPLGGEVHYRMNGRPFIRSQNVGWGELILDDVVHIDDDTHASFAATELEEGDVLLNITGASIGRSAVADARIAGGNVNQHVCIIRVLSDQILSRFLSQYLISRHGQEQIDSCQAGGNRQGLNFGQIRSFLIPQPRDLGEQERIADCLRAADISLANQVHRINALKRHKQGLLQQLFPALEGQ